VRESVQGRERKERNAKEESEAKRRGGGRRKKDEGKESRKERERD